MNTISTKRLSARIGYGLAIVGLLFGSLAGAQSKPVGPGPRLYIFDNGMLNVTDPTGFGFTRAELKETKLVVVSYLIVHPRGTLVFDAGVIPDADFAGTNGTVVQGGSSASKPLAPQLAAAGYRPGDITYFALSHYHGDHTANAALFAGSTWIVQRAEHDAMFDPTVQIIGRDHFAALRDARTKILDNEDLDVFGDRTVIVKAAPGHTPGHQVLFVKLAKTGPVLLAGDLYHYPEERTTGRMPTFEFNPAQTRVTRAKIDAFLKETGAQLWIEHDLATHEKLPRAPEYLD